MAKYIMSFDAGTTSNRCILFNQQGQVCSWAQKEFTQIFPKPGWVEHDAHEIWATQLGVAVEAMGKIGASAADIAAIGITNQRETTIVWDKATGEPVCNAIVWQCRRTAPLVERLKRDGLGNVIRDRTGLIPDAYFAGTKLQWMLDAIPGSRERALDGELCFGTVDSFLVWNLTGGRVHVTDATNAARTMLYNIYEQRWDEKLLQAMNIPAELLPEVVDSSQVVGYLDKRILGREIPIAALAGDQHAALFGQGCFAPGMCKNTYGTGCFVLMNTGKVPVKSQNDLITTIGWRVDGQPRYALEGSVFVGGAVVQWLRDEMKLVTKASETEAVAMEVPDNGNVYFVPAFTGLGAPHWDMYSRGTIVGLTRGTGRAHIVRAALEAIAYQSADVISAMAADSSMKSGVLRVDGGASANNFLMQFQADILGVHVLRPKVIETTAMGAAMLAGRAVGLWTDAQLGALQEPDREFAPNMDDATRARLLSQWQRAIERSRGWETDEN